MKKISFFIIILIAFIGCTNNPEIPRKTVPTLGNTAPISNITPTSAMSGGTISSNGGHVIVERGICWGTNTNPTIDNFKKTVVGGLGSFAAEITGLDTGTTYNVRAFVTTTTGTYYANQVSFRTLSLPILTTSVTSSISNTSATSGGNISNSGGANITARGVCWDTNPGPTVSLPTKTNNGTGIGSFTSLIPNLTPGVKYYVRAYATNSVGTSYGIELSFTTQNLPSVSTNSVTTITATSAISGGNVISDGGATITSRGVCWNTTGNPTIANSRTIDGSGIGLFSSTMTGLTSGTTYYVRAYATNSVGTTYGVQLSFTTLNAPSVSTNSVTSVTTTSANSGGNVFSDGGSAVTARGVCWNTTGNPTIANSRTIDGSGTGLFLSTMTGLSPGTTYFVRAYAINSAGTTYGVQFSFTTQNVPSVSTNSVTNITTTSANSGGNVFSDGGSAVTSRGVCWNTMGNPTIANSRTIDGSGTGLFSSTMTGLSPGITYYVRAYATNSAGTTYGVQFSFTTQNTPSVSTSSVSSITTTSANSGGNVFSDGGSAVTSRGVCWNTTGNPTIANSRTVNGSGLGLFSSTMTGLTPGATYYVRAYATNSAGTTYGVQFSFTTRNVPSVTTNSVTSITTTYAFSGGNVLSDGGSAVTSRGVCWNTTGNPTIANSRTINGSGTGLFSSTMTGLSPSTTYYVRAYAINAWGTSYGSIISFRTN